MRIWIDGEMGDGKRLSPWVRWLYGLVAGWWVAPLLMMLVILLQLTIVGGPLARRLAPVVARAMFL